MGETVGAAAPGPDVVATGSSDPVIHDARLLRLATGESQTLPVGLVPESATDLRLSPDRRRLAYIGRDAGDAAGPATRLWVVDVEGTDRSPLGPEDARPTDPAWSPDGRSIVYVDRGTLRVVDLRSGRDRRLVGVSSDGIWLPSFHPDGTTILYTRVTPGGRHLELWTVPVRGGSPRRLKRDAAFGTWSPDGTTIAFRRFGRAVEPYLIWPYRTNGLFLMDRSGRQTRTVMRASGSMMAPIDWSQTRAAWAPDGSRLVFALYPGPDASVRVVELRSGHVTHIGCGTEPSWWDARTLLIERPAPCRGSTLTPRPIDLRSAATGSRR